jgi:hypothetical protein
MAFNVSPEAQMALFNIVFGKTNITTQRVAFLVAKGAKVDVSLYVVKISLKDKIHSQALTVGTSALIKGSVADTMKSQNMYLLRTFVDNVLMACNLDIPVNLQTVGKLSAADPLPQTTTIFVSPMNAPEVVTPLEAVIKPAQKKPVTEVIPLKEAQALGQKVKGTSHGSVYRVVALHKNVKIATQLSGNSMSVRVEWIPSTATNDALASLSNVFDMKKGYASKHLSLDGLTAARVLGAFLYSIDIKFDEQVTTMQELKDANA